MRLFALAFALYWPGALAEESIVCRDGWCLVRQDELQKLAESLRAMALHVQELRVLCKWEPKP